MKHDEQSFTEYLIESLKNIEDTSIKKAGEYDTNSEQFSTIDGVANLLGVSRRKACVTLASKHFVSLVNNIDKYNRKTIREKVDDIFIYLKIAEYGVGD